MQPRVAALTILVLAGMPACSDPVRSGQLDSLGGEKPGVPTGPLHRPGQPCVLCHGGDGPAGSDFSFGGTVYQEQMRNTPLSDALVQLIDSKNRKYQVATNCTGNFFVMKTDYNPAYPVWVKIQFGEMGGQPLAFAMTSPIYRDGSCAGCHSDPAGVQSAGHVFLAPMLPAAIPNMGCP